jgi:hypothetical protein
LRRGGRLYWRMVRTRERALSAAPEAVIDWDYRELNYDRNDIMDKIDSLPMGWRMLINEHGFTAVMRARDVSTDINIVERLMKQRHAHRQQQLAEGRA